MMTYRVGRCIAGVWMVALLGLAGCATTAPTRFYVLTTLPNPERLHPLTENARPLALGVGPVELPRYLDRPQIATWAGANTLRFAEFDQWAEPLQEGVTRVLAENLSRVLATDDVAIHPWPRSVPVAYQIVVRITRFEGTLGEESVLTARWQINDLQANRELLRKTSSFAVPTEGADYNAIVAAMTRGLGALSQEIAQELRTLVQN